MPADPVPPPRGFSAAGRRCGIKRDPAKFDLSLFASDRPAAAAGVFSTNQVVGAPVVYSRELVPADGLRAVAVNSGCANVCTGDRGLEDVRRTAAAVAAELGCDPAAVAVLSTGVIGHFLPIEQIAAGVPPLAAGLAASPAGLRDAAEGMRTTDTFPKLSTRLVDAPPGGGGEPGDGEPGRDESGVRISGAAKGAAMVAPHMATMLAVVLTDAELAPADADRLLRAAVDRTFNRISIDGHQSTSDAVILLANGAAGPVDESAFAAALGEVCEELATDIVRDAEGAGHFVTVDVTGLPTDADAEKIARAVADDVLLKCAIHGADPNWGRMLFAAGNAGVSFDVRRASAFINGVTVCRGGQPAEFDEGEVSRSLREHRDCSLTLDFAAGPGACRFWGCDLTAEYVRLNADYTT